VTDVAHEFALEVGYRREYATRDDIAFDLGEPQFDLVEPRGVCRGEVHMNTRIVCQKRFHALGLVRREVVCDHVNLRIAGLIHDDVCQEGHELCRGVTGSGLAQYLAGLGVEGRGQRKRAVAEVFETMTLRAAWRQRQHRILAVKRLNCGLLINTEDRSVLGRIQIQPNHVGGLGLGVGIVREGAKCLEKPSTKPIFGSERSGF